MTVNNDSEIMLDATDVSVEDLEIEMCECEEAPVEKIVWVDYRSAGMKVCIGKYCAECAEKTAMAIRKGLPQPPSAPIAQEKAKS